MPTDPGRVWAIFRRTSTVTPPGIFGPRVPTESTYSTFSAHGMRTTSHSSRRLNCSGIRPIQRAGKGDNSNYPPEWNLPRSLLWPNSG